MDQHEMYEPPAVAEVGDFAGLTRGEPFGMLYEGGQTVFEWYTPNG
ncbi:lasso RiPP family leader peptide-containing protein [Streptomyces sp. NPDC046261]